MLGFDSLHLRSTRIPRQRCDWPLGATEVKSFFGQQVLWCPYQNGGCHLSETELEPYRLVGDPLVDNLLESLEKEGRPLRAGDDLVALAEQVEQGASSSSTSNLSPELLDQLQSFLQYHKTLPSWVDLPQLQRGQNVMLAYLPAIGASLYYRSLVAGFAIPKIAAVIQATGYLAPPSRPDQVTVRLLDTGALLSACVVGGVETLLPGGDGWKTALRVRVLHAKVRRALLKRSTTGSRAWDIPSLGIPINQEDMSATLLAFSTNVLWGIEFIAGMAISQQEQLDFTALWRYIGWLLGVHTVNDSEITNLKLCPLDPCGPGWLDEKNLQEDQGNSIRHSHAMLESIILHLFRPNESSVIISHHLLQIARPKKYKEDDKNDPHGKKKSVVRNDKDKWFYFRALQCRRFIGDPLANALELPQYETWWKRMLLYCASHTYLLLLRAYTLTAILCPPAKQWFRQTHLNMMTDFHKNWQEHHVTRMSRELGKGNGKQGDSIRAKSIETEEELNANDGGTMNSMDSSCPFAMVKPPQY